MRRPDATSKQRSLRGWERWRFSENGQFQRMAAGGVPLAAPWGLALAPAGFGPFSGDLLVGNFIYGQRDQRLRPEREFRGHDPD
jgi:hypothetical protein